MTMLPYREVISDTDVSYIKRVSISTSPISKDQLCLLQTKIHKLYEDYNTNVLKPTSDKPILIWDGKILLDNSNPNIALDQAADLADNLNID
jgi:hypothetical protein